MIVCILIRVLNMKSMGYPTESSTSMEDGTLK